MNPFEFGQAVAGFMKKADMLGDAGNLLGQSWNNSARVFKGMTGGAAGALGAAGAGIAGGGMQAANAVGGMFGKQPFSNEAIDTAYGAADRYADVGSAYGKDLVNSLGMGPQGMAGTLQPGSHGDQAWQNLTNAPGVTPGARQFSNRAFNVVDTAATMAPAAAIGTGAKMLSAAGKAAPAASAIGRAGQATARVAAPVAAGASKLTSSSNPAGASAKMMASAAK